MSSSSKSGPCYPELEKICNCGRRCKVATSTTLKNPKRRFVHYRKYGGGGGFDYFEWVEESIDERVRSMVVGLMVSNDTVAAEIKRLENDLEAQKHEVKKLKEKNRRMELKLYAWQRRQKLYDIKINQNIAIFLKKGKGKNDLSCACMYEIRNVIKHKFVAARNDSAVSFNSSKRLSLTFVVFTISLANIATYNINKFALHKNPWHLQKQEEHPQKLSSTTSRQ
ncbi:hypothetical protein Cgig2_014202 [Carnegiea gigantea]|uniref:Uncharacterized protein n=1 Tax=Carnegiea gigantea TaxID=171969 RepID=A0A9Q1JS79_9CARY|nr:hypothetical protein Cgig2_014202 [Carnegiea gigantea]